jgi:hypothetical protein
MICDTLDKRDPLTQIFDGKRMPAWGAETYCDSGVAGHDQSCA